MNRLQSMLKCVAKDLKLSESHLQTVYEEFKQGATVPFIARYRKHKTGEMTEVVLRDVQNAFEQYEALANRKDSVLKVLNGISGIDQAVIRKVEECNTLDVLEDLYLPYKPKRATLAQKARDLGFDSVAQKVLTLPTFNPVKDFLAERVIKDEDRTHVLNIVTESISHCGEIREFLRTEMLNHGSVSVTSVTSTRKRKNAEMTDEQKEVRASVYKSYESFRCPPLKMKSHQVMAILRGESEGFLKVSIDFYNDERVRRSAEAILAKSFAGFTEKTMRACVFRKKCIDTAWSKYLLPQAETHVRAVILRSASKDCLDVFCSNLRGMLLMRPVRKARIFAMDPGFKSIKCAMLDEFGNIVGTHMITLSHFRFNDKTVQDLAIKLVEWSPNKIAIGNGNGSRQCEYLVSETLKSNETLKDIEYAIVSEIGASVYSASEVAGQELGHLDILYRGAVSIGRRLQDPLSELVKIEPKSLGVGQYQHDLKEAELTKSLKSELESCVSSVGVNLNTASSHVLKYVAGLNQTLAQAIVDYRANKGPFQSRSELQKIKGITDLVFQQAAGFLRIPEGKEPLDNTGVHPESYKIARNILKLAPQSDQEVPPTDVLTTVASKERVSLAEVTEVAKDLAKPRVDPRDTLPNAHTFRHDVLDISQITAGLKLKGVVRNITSFGAFVDIGVGKDALMPTKYVTKQVNLGSTVDIVVESITFPIPNNAESARMIIKPDN
eukprot:PhF_6_TR30101/c0_g1_i1/m.43920/K06959/tex; protein Tex